MASYVIIDQTNTSVFAFTSISGDSWFPEDTGGEYEGNAMETWTVGAFATVSFTGTSIELYGTLALGIDASVRIDDGNPIPLNQNTGTTTVRTSLYTSPELPYDNHKLVVTEEDNSFPLVVDFVKVNTAGAPPTIPQPEITPPTPKQVQATETQQPTTIAPIPSTSNTTSTPTPAVTDSSSDTTSTLGSASFKPSQSTSSVADSPVFPATTFNTDNTSGVPSPSQSSTTSPIHSSLNKSEIIGIAVGGILALIILIVILILLLCLWKRQNKHISTLALTTPDADSSTTTPSFLSTHIGRFSGRSRGQEQGRQFRRLLDETPRPPPPPPEKLPSPQQSPSSGSNQSIREILQTTTMTVASTGSTFDYLAFTHMPLTVRETQTVDQQAVTSPSPSPPSGETSVDAGVMGDRRMSETILDELPPYPGSVRSI